MAVKGLALAIPLGGKKEPAAPAEEKPASSSGYDMALDDAWDAIQGGDRDLFKKAMREAWDLMNAPPSEEDEA